MQIKKFEARNMTEALGMVKKEFGPDAVILSAKSLKRGRGVFGANKKAKVEVTAATDNNNAPIKKSNYSKVKKIDYIDRPDVDDVQTSIRKKRIADMFQESFRSFKKRTLPEKPKVDKRLDRERQLTCLAEKFMAQGINDEPALELASAVNKRISLNEPVSDFDLKEYLSLFIDRKHFIFKPRVPAGEGEKIIALVGPTGVGKTTTIAKLAADYTIKMNKQTALITLDDYRIGAVEQLGIYAGIIGIPMKSVSCRDELMAALESFKEYDRILIDTPGIGRAEVFKLKELKNCLNKIGSTSVYLTLSSSTQTEDLVEIADQFERIPIRAYIFTKLDESLLHGNIVNLLFRTKIPVAYFTNGQQVPEDIFAASADLLSDLMLNKEKGETGLADSQKEDKDSQAVKVLSVQQSDEYYVANKNSDIFHCPKCKAVERIKQNNIIFFESIKEAENKNFYPCRMCIPARAENNNPLYEPARKKIIGGGLK